MGRETSNRHDVVQDEMPARCLLALKQAVGRCDLRKDIMLIRRYRGVKAWNALADP
jgi:hypothetical protein